MVDFFADHLNVKLHDKGEIGFFQYLNDHKRYQVELNFADIDFQFVCFDFLYDNFIILIDALWVLKKFSSLDIQET